VQKGKEKTNANILARNCKVVRITFASNNGN